MAASLLAPTWPAPANVKAFVTTRAGGYSQAPYDRFNLGGHVGDLPETVALNRHQLQQKLGQELDFHWLQQVHGCQVAEHSTATVGQVKTADAAFTRQSNQVCLVMTADCLPVLFTNHQGDCVAAAHAGWRGLCDGVLEATVNAMGCQPGELLAWLGPAIGSQHFQVGSEVREAFVELLPATAEAFKQDHSESGKWLGDLYLLARLRLQQLGLNAIYGGGECTYRQADRYYSYRRDGVTGRMATGIWIAPQTASF